MAVRLRLPRQPGLSRIPSPVLGAVLRFPKGTRGWTEPDGAFRSEPMDEAPRQFSQPLTLNYFHGKMACLLGCANPDSHISGYVRMATTPWERPWLVLLLADRPCDLPARSGVLRDLGVRGAQPEVAAVTGDAARNCMLPFMRHPLWQAPAEESIATSTRSGGAAATPAAASPRPS